jgi:hypothetical protein
MRHHQGELKMDKLINRQNTAQELYIVGSKRRPFAVPVTFMFDGMPDIVMQFSPSKPIVLFATNKMFRTTRATYKGFKF